MQLLGDYLFLSVARENKTILMANCIAVPLRTPKWIQLLGDYLFLFVVRESIMILMTNRIAVPLWMRK